MLKHEHVMIKNVQTFQCHFMQERECISCLSLTLRMLLKRPLIDLLHKTYGDMQTACMCKYLGIIEHCPLFKDTYSE